jgi:hypothetical protein
MFNGREKRGLEKQKKSRIMRRETFNRLVSENNFQTLFITEMGWNHCDTDFFPITVDETEYAPEAVAIRNGFHVLTCEVTDLPTTTVCKKIDYQLRKQANDYIIIFKTAQRLEQLWVAPIRTSEKREIVPIEFHNIGQTEFLFSKIDGLSFGLDEKTTIVDVKERVQGAFEVNSAKITKDFYAGFRKQHNSFAKFISGIEVEGDRQWYVSVMLNRLMFCYFIQKKGFLDGDENYLRDKLAWVQEQRGEDKFFSSFYKGFLCVLFRGGLNSPEHDQDFESTYGKIPYLNGGMFDKHQLEIQYADIDIEDAAFENLFDFFDKWRWHLDTRITASGKDINPDVLGYIFEQYINDRAQMGAYYTKEDITGYIGRNCIVPFLFDKTAKKSANSFKPQGEVWNFLRKRMDENGVSVYIYDAVKKGYGLQLPEEIAIGLDTEKPDLLERRKHWNEKASEEFALPTEIWRETITRLQHCKEVNDKIANGDVTQINDFITYNLDICQFTNDLLANTDDHLLIEHFYEALQSVTILDPTCGSGAFLFAAMNILEPLYEICITRMEEFHAKNENLFNEQLNEIAEKYRSNRQYFIFKSIILRNLYGVDIMNEAVEIAKLRLFLKMVAVVEVNKRLPNLGLDPLPDIDFNIRCGNTLVGYATEQQLDEDLNYGDMFAKQEFKEKVEDEMDQISMLFERFKLIQLTQNENSATFKEVKQKLNEKLKGLNNTLNHKQYTSMSYNLEYDEWLKTHQPFNWLAEFYHIMHGNGGFDVIIGNPPYVTFTDNSLKYRTKNYETYSTKNLFALIGEKTIILSNNKSSIGYIIPLSGMSIKSFSSFQNLIYNYGLSWNSFFSGDRNPSELFTGVKIRAGIYISRKSELKIKFVGSYLKYYSSERQYLFYKIIYTKSEENESAPKIGSFLGTSIIKKINENSSKSIECEFINESSVYYYAAPIFWSKALLDLEYMSKLKLNISDAYKKLQISEKYKYLLFLILNSSSFFYYWIVFSDCYNLTKKFISAFKVPSLDDQCSDYYILSTKLQKDMIVNIKTAEYCYKK